MKMKGGFLPKISGKPSGFVEELRVPEKLYISAIRGCLAYTPVFQNLQYVLEGEPLAQVQVAGGTLFLPSPASGKVSLTETEDGSVIFELDTTVPPEREAASGHITIPSRINRSELCSALSKAGLWQLLWSSKTNGTPSLEGEFPHSILVNLVTAEPYRTRGKVILDRRFKVMMEGIKYFNTLVADYGTVEVSLTLPNHPVSKTIYKELSGHVWIKFITVPLRYPVENNHLLRKASRASGKDDIVWIIDAQGAAAFGEYVTSGKIPGRRTLCIGGPGCINPRHLSVTVGTPLKNFMKEENLNEVAVLRGGLFTGEQIDPDKACVTYDDDAFFLLPDEKKREFLSFLRPGFGKSSYLPVYAADLTRKGDSGISTLLRGELRPCISCGLCETICPVGLFPQILHRYLFNDELDEAEKIGLDRCVDCNLCTYVCPSKIELQQQFAGAKEQLRVEHEEAEALIQRQKEREEM